MLLSRFSSVVRTSPRVAFAFALFAVTATLPGGARAAEATPTPSPTPSPTPRVLEFPEDRSLGRLRTYDREKSEWVELGEARGKVSVPGGASITLSVSQEGANDLSPIAKLPEDALRSVQMTSLDVTPGQLAHLKSQKKLQKLGLRESRVDDEAMKAVAALESLVEVDVGFTKVGDAGVAHLAALPYLATLDVSYTEVGDGSVDALIAFPSLSYLDPQRSRMTPEGCQRIMDENPAIAVVQR